MGYVPPDANGQSSKSTMRTLRFQIVTSVLLLPALVFFILTWFLPR